MAAFDAGSIEARLELDRSNFDAGIERAKAEGKQLEGQQFNASLGANAEQVTAAVKKAQGELDSLKGQRSDVLIGGNNAELDRQITEAEAKLDELKKKEAETGAEGESSFRRVSDAIGKMHENIDKTVGRVDEMHGKMLEAMEGGRAGAERAAGAVEHLASSMGHAHKFTSDFGASVQDVAGSKIPLLIGGIGALSSAALPALGLATEAALGLAGAVTVAGIGFGSLGILASPILGSIKTDMTALLPLQKAWMQAQPGPQQEQAWKALQFVIGKLPDGERQVVQGIFDLKAQLRDLSDQVKPNFLAAFSEWMGAAHALLPQLVAPAKATADAMGVLGGHLRDDFNSPGFHLFMSWATNQMSSVITGIGHAVGELAAGFGHLLMDSTPLISDFVNGLQHITTEFNHWAENKGPAEIEKLMNFVHQNGPEMKRLLDDVANAFVAIAHALAQVTGLNLKILDFIAQAITTIAKIPGVGPMAADITLLAFALAKFGILGPAVTLVGKMAGALRELGAASLSAAGFERLAGFIAPTAKAAEGGAGSVGKLATSSGGLTAAAAQLLPRLLPLAPELLAVAGAAGLVALAVDGLHNNYAGMVQGMDTGQPVLSAANSRILEQRDAVKQLNDEISHAGPAFKQAVGAIDQALGTLPTDVADKGIQAEQKLAEAIKNGQAPNMASINAKNILDAYNTLLSIPGIGDKVMQAMSLTIDSHGKDLGQDVLNQVHGLISEYGQLAPGVQQQVLKAMSDLQSGLATHNDEMIKNAKAQLALLSAAYGQAGANIVQTGSAAFGELVTDVEKQQDKLTAQTQFNVASLKQSYATLPAPVKASADQAMGALDAALKSGNAEAIASASSAVGFIAAHYNQMPPDVQGAIDSAMKELNDGLASGNQRAIDDASRKLAVLQANYESSAQIIAAKGGAAADGFAHGMDANLQAGLGQIVKDMGGYEAAVAGGLNPLLAAIGANIGNVGPGGGPITITAGTGDRSKYALGGTVTKPGLFMAGEEAPQGFTETIISHNPAYRTANIEYWKKAGKALGIPGFQQGGFMDASQVPHPPDSALLALGGAAKIPALGSPGAGFVGDQGAQDLYNKTVQFVNAAKAARDAAAAAVSSAGGSPFGGGPVKAYMLGEVAKRWPGEAEAAAFDFIESHEAGYNPNAANPSSNARGLAQKIDGWGPGYEPGNVQQQTQWMINYIAGRYGDPLNAAAFWRAHNWYGDGGIFTEPTIIGVGEKGPEAVVPLSPDSGMFHPGLGTGPGGGYSFAPSTQIIVQGDLTREAVKPLSDSLAARDQALLSELSARGWSPNRLPGAG